MRHLASHVVEPYHVERFKPFFGTRLDAEALARKDYDQYVIAAILGYKGNSDSRETIEFLVCFADDDTRWRTFDRELFETTAYEEFCRSRPELQLLIYTTRESAARTARYNKLPITEVSSGDTIFLDVRFLGGAEWYNSLQLPDHHSLIYVLSATYQDFVSNRKLKIMLHIALLNETYRLSHMEVLRWGSRRSLAGCILIDQHLLSQYPAILPQAPV